MLLIKSCFTTQLVSVSYRLKRKATDLQPVTFPQTNETMMKQEAQNQLPAEM